MRKLLQGLLVGTVFALFLNAGNLALFVGGDLALEHLVVQGTDEQYYTALVRDAATGYPALGHATLKEHRFDQTVTSFAPSVQGLMMRLSGLSLPAALLLGDLLFPLLAILFFFLAFRFLLPSPWTAAMAAVSSALYLDTYWLRAANPQIPYVLVSLWLAVFLRQLQPGSGLSFWRYVLRALCIGLLVYTQMLYASLLIIAEGTDALRRLFQERAQWKKVFRDLAIFGGTFLPLLIPKILTSLRTAGDPAIADTFHRLGIIPSHYPAAPKLQIVLVLLCVLLFVARRKRASVENQKRVDVVLTLLVASLIGLNQAVVHGIDATFTSYYANVIVFFQWLAGALLVVMALRYRWAVLPLAAVIVLWQGIHVQKLLVQDARAVDALIVERQESGMADVLHWLSTQSGELVIAAPRMVANAIPAHTDHYVLFNNYAFNQRAEDRELAERFLLHQALFPGDFVPDRTYQAVFGGYPGMASAKERTACRLWAWIKRSSEDCTKDPHAYVLHPEVLAMLEQPSIDPQTLLQKYTVDVIVTDQKEASATCPIVQEMGRYRVMGCVR